ncbi:MAG: peptidase M3, partial [Rhodobacteraceae bacterium]|nr:peptidase M3 [Paracoccaceae bacterium]
DGTGAGGAKTDNRPIAAEILRLRHERARLLGYADFASYKLEPEMAGNAENVEALLTEVWTYAKARADRDAARFTEMLHADGVNGALEPWDWRYFAERRRKAEHDLDEAEIKPYLTLDAMIGAVFDTANRLFGLEMREFQAPLWSPETRAWEVTRKGQRLAVFLGDYYARPSKRSGAWCSTLQSQHRIGAG